MKSDVLYRPLHLVLLRSKMVGCVTPLLKACAHCVYNRMHSMRCSSNRRNAKPEACKNYRMDLNPSLKWPNNIPLGFGFQWVTIYMF